MFKRGPATSLKAQGKAPPIQAELIPPAETDEELACWLQVKELAAEETRQGRDVATLEVIMEAARLLTCG